VPREDPVTSLRQMAQDIGRFADVLEAATDIDARVLRYWRARLLEIASQLEGSSGP
jgi:hypothetical protein